MPSTFFRPVITFHAEPGMLAKVNLFIKDRKKNARRTGYAKKIRDYGPTYNRSIRTVKRWIALGRAAGDPPPLDDPQAMPAWNLRIHNRQPPRIELVRVEPKDTRRHERYKKPLSYYADVFGISLRTVKRHIHRGKQTGDLPDLDDPPKYQEWLSKNYGSQRRPNPLNDQLQSDMSPWLIPPE